MIIERVPLEVRTLFVYCALWLKTSHSRIPYANRDAGGQHKREVRDMVRL